jgi:glycosyltransferase involved in cell wall biosynthesis
MKIAFNTRLLYAPSLRGWNRYTVNLLVQLGRLGVRLFLYCDRPLHDSQVRRLAKAEYVIRVAPTMRYWRWEQRWLPRQCAEDGVDLLHCPFNFGLPWSSPCPRVLTLHDAIDYVYYRPRAGLRERLSPAALKTRLHQWIARTRADAVITVSEHARADLVKRLRVPPEKVYVTHEAADDRFHAPVGAMERLRVRRQHGLAAPYVLYLGGWERRKNVGFLVRAFAAACMPGVDLVLVGGTTEQCRELLRLFEALGVAGHVHLLEWVPDADLPALYAEALCFVYPSEYEGFGLQLCEAMAAGCPTLAARATSLPEVLGPGGLTCTLDHHGELAAELRRLRAEPDFRADLVARARARAHAFSWERTAEQTLDVYHRLLAIARSTVAEVA